MLMLLCCRCVVVGAFALCCLCFVGGVGGLCLILLLNFMFYVDDIDDVGVDMMWMRMLCLSMSVVLFDDVIAYVGVDFDFGRC